MSAVLLGVAGAAVVGPFVAHAVRRWVGGQVVLPISLLSPPWVVGVEAATGVVFGLSAWRFGWSWRLGPVLVCAAGLVAIAAVDVACQRVPTRFVVVTGAGAAATAVAAALSAGTWGALGAALVGSAAYGGFMALAYLLAPSGLGGGDVRLAGLVGGVVGWATWSADRVATSAVSAVLAALLLSIGIGLTTHLVVALRRRTVGPLPFGPAIGVGAFVVVLSQPL